MGYIVVRSSRDKEAAHNMSSMVKHLISVAAVILPAFAAYAQPQPTELVWQRGTGTSTPAAMSMQPSDPSEGNIPAALQRWKTLSQSASFSFGEYASFLMKYPDWPDSEAMRKNAEQAISPLSDSPNQIVAYFDRLPPLTNTGRAKFAIALDATGDKLRAETMARAAWRGGPLTDDDEARLQNMVGARLTSADHDARTDRLLWAGATRAAERHIAYTSPQRRLAFAATLAAKSNSPDAAIKIQQAGSALKGEASFLATQADQLRNSGNSYAARELLANRPNLVAPAPVLKDWYKLLLTHAQGAANDGQYDLAYRIASRVDDAIAPEDKMADQDLSTRDNYTSLTWLAGTLAMDRLGRPRDAIGMFGRYAEAAKSPQTRSKGFYWAGKAAARAGDMTLSAQQYANAGIYYENFYGQLALEALGRPLPMVPQGTALPNIALESAPPSFLAARLATKYGTWKDQSNFLRAISKSANTQEQFLSALSLSKTLNRPDLAVMAGRNARQSGFDGMVRYAYPTVDVPASQAGNWTLIHAIARQESQFDKAAVSHAGARGLMQLMPGTARETSGKISMSYRPDALTVDTDYNIQLGSTYIQRMLNYYNGSYPLAVAAYNAGPGNVNKWLAANGDPRTGAIGVLEWIEKIPLFETRNYVQRVLENAVVYDHLHPEKARIKSVTPLSTYLGKSTPG